MSEDLELTMYKEIGPDQIGYVPNEERPKRQMAKFYAVIVASDMQFDCIVVADDKRNLKAKIESLQKKCDDDGMSFSISSIIKGHEVKFKETKAIEFL